MLIMTSTIRIGQSKFVTVPIDEDSAERIMNCIQTLSELETQPDTKEIVKEIFLEDTKKAYSKMLGAQEVNSDIRASEDVNSSPVCCNRNVPLKRKRQRRPKLPLYRLMTYSPSGSSRRRPLTRELTYVIVCADTTQSWPTDSSTYSMLLTSAVQPVAQKFRRTLCLTFVAFRSLLVSPTQYMRRLMLRCTASTSCLVWGSFRPLATLLTRLFL